MLENKKIGIFQNSFKMEEVKNARDGVVDDGENFCGIPIIGRKILSSTSGFEIRVDFMPGEILIPGAVIIERGLSGGPETARRYYKGL